MSLSGGALFLNVYPDTGVGSGGAAVAGGGEQQQKLRSIWKLIAETISS